MPVSNYYERSQVSAAIDAGQHREVIGGMWEEIGGLQLNFLKTHGLLPHHRLLDIGCGSLRLGVKAVAYLDAESYWGTDLNPDLLSSGYDREIVPAGLAPKLPREHLVEDDRFSFPAVERHIDFAIAQSVFTHLPLSYLTTCLVGLEHHLKSPCRFFFTVFVAGDPYDRPFEQASGIVTHADRDPYHYRMDDLQAASLGTSWKLNFLGDWSHPRNQKMVEAQLA